MSLIVVPQHTPEDLVEWARTRAMDARRARQLAFRRQVIAAVAVLHGFAKDGPCFAGVSWGKDSVVVAHLAWSLAEGGGPRVPLIHAHPAAHDHPHALVANPHVAAVRDAFLARWPLTYEEVSVIAVHGDGGRWVAPNNAGGRDVFDEALMGRHVSGIRGEESARRRRRMASYGTTTENTCAPIGWWTAEDVFAYLEAYDLPVHPAYAMTFGGRLDRRRLRVAALGGDTGQGHGRAEWEARYYGPRVTP